MVLPFHGLVVNSSNPWATTQEQLQELYDCPFIGAVTTRTSLENQGWPEDQRQQYRFFDGRMLDGTWDNSVTPSTNLYSSINSLGYSPLKLDEYLKFAVAITRNSKPHDKKPFIISVTGSTPESVANCLRKITEISRVEGITFLMEVNLSCPNIPDRAPPAYNAEELGGYLQAIQAALKQNSEGERQVAVGIKIPPYTYSGQFDDLTKALLNSCIDSQSCPISFITATNTLGNCLVLEPDSQTDAWTPLVSSISGEGIGGLGGLPLHALALGNVRTLRRRLNAHAELQHIDLIGTGGVHDRSGAERMLKAGAAAVGVGTAFGVEGVQVFEKISRGLSRVKAM